MTDPAPKMTAEESFLCPDCRAALKPILRMDNERYWVHPVYDCPKNIVEKLRTERAEGFAEAREMAAHIVEGDVLLSADEFDAKTKIKVFDLLERIFVQIRAMKMGGEK